MSLLEAGGGDDTMTPPTISTSVFLGEWGAVQGAWGLLLLKLALNGAEERGRDKEQGSTSLRLHGARSDSCRLCRLHGSGCDSRGGMEGR